MICRSGIYTSERESYEEKRSGEKNTERKDVVQRSPATLPLRHANTSMVTTWIPVETESRRRVWFLNDKHNLFYGPSQLALDYIRQNTYTCIFEQAASWLILSLFPFIICCDGNAMLRPQGSPHATKLVDLSFSFSFMHYAL